LDETGAAVRRIWMALDITEAFETSVSQATIARVIEGCAQFGMILAPA